MFSGLRDYRHAAAAFVAGAWMAVSGAPASAQNADSAPHNPPGKRIVVGFTETVRLYPGDLPIRAKIDTGARTSSLNAEDIISFERDGKLWVRFHVTNRDNRTQTFERPVVRHVLIKDLTGPSLSRPVVMMGICIGEVFKITEVNLSNRAGFNFPLLVGRRFMRRTLVVDPGRQFTRAPSCTVSEADLRGLNAVPGLPAPIDGDR